MALWNKQKYDHSFRYSCNQIYVTSNNHACVIEQIVGVKEHYLLGEKTLNIDFKNFILTESINK